MKVSIIVPTYKDIVALRLILMAFNEQTYSNFELIIAEDDDSIQTAQLLKEVNVKFEINVSIVWSFFTYLFSIFIGSISILPAGLGITDGSITILLSNIGISREVSVSTALIIRIATLWFSLIIGSISMMKFNKILMNNHK